MEIFQLVFHMFLYSELSRSLAGTSPKRHCNNKHVFDVSKWRQGSCSNKFSRNTKRRRAVYETKATNLSKARSQRNTLPEFQVNRSRNFLFETCRPCYEKYIVPASTPNISRETSLWHAGHLICLKCAAGRRHNPPPPSIFLFLRCIVL